MSERFERLFSLPQNLYAEGAPVLIAAGALLKDNQTGNVLAQLKLQSICAQIIVAVKVRLTLFDVAGKELPETQEYPYLDLRVVRDDFFGEKTAIKLQNQTARSFSASVIEVVFADKSVWAEELPWAPLSQQKAFFEKTQDPNLREQYQIALNEKAEFLFLQEKDLWRCACGAINRTGETHCHNHACQLSRSVLQDLNWDTLQKDCDTRLQKEAEEEETKRLEAERKAEERRIAAEKAVKKRKKIIAITTPIAIACIAFLVVLATVMIPNGKYSDAINLLEKGDIVNAYESLLALNGYKDSTEKANKIFGEYKIEKLKFCAVGDTVYFGAYEQDNNISNGKEDIEWLVLEKEGDKALVISRYALDCRQYNTSYTSVTWENCSLRKWLNGTFFISAFSSEEKDSIKNTTVTADKNPSFSTSPGNNTTDKIFLLSSTEANKYFSSDSARQCSTTAYAKTQETHSFDSIDNCWWWLRSPGSSRSAEFVDWSGSVNVGDLNVDFVDGMVRPAMWITTQ